MTTKQLKTTIQKDIEELKEILPNINEGLLPDEDDTEKGDADALGDLVTEIDKVKKIVESENGLNDKLEEWSYRQNKEEETNNDF